MHRSRLARSIRQKRLAGTTPALAGAAKNIRNAAALESRCGKVCMARSDFGVFCKRNLAPVHFQLLKVTTQPIKTRAVAISLASQQEKRKQNVAFLVNLADFCPKQYAVA